MAADKLGGSPRRDNGATEKNQGRRDLLALHWESLERENPVYREHLMDVGERVRERRKGLKDGDVTWLETRQGRKEKGVLKTVEGQHPKTVTIAGQARLWARGRPVARGKGSNFDRLLESDLKHYDPLILCLETAVPVKVYKAGR